MVLAVPRHRGSAFHWQPVRSTQKMPCFDYEVYERLKLIQVLGQPLGHLNQRNIAVDTSDGSTIGWAFLQGADACLARPVGTGDLMAAVWRARENHLAAVLHLPAVPRVRPDGMRAASD